MMLRKRLLSESSLFLMDVVMVWYEVTATPWNSSLTSTRLEAWDLLLKIKCRILGPVLKFKTCTIIFQKTVNEG